MSLREQYPEGAVFEVVAEGVQLLGMKSSGPSAWRGWSRALAVGERVTCLGVKWGWGSDPGLEVAWRVDEPGVSHVTIIPAKWGAMSSAPADGVLRRVSS